MKCEHCLNPATLHITEIGKFGDFIESHVCERCVEQVAESPSPSMRSGKPDRRDAACRFVLVRIIINEIDDRQIVVLHEVGGERVFPITIGFFEATSIDRKVKGFQSPRPLTHDAWADTITALGGTLQDVLIKEIRDATYFAALRIRHVAVDNLVEVDVRPSDAINIAIHHDAPIFIKDEVADQVCG